MSRLEGVVTSLFVGNDPTSLVKRRVSEVKVTFEGFAGDKHAGLTRKADSRTPHYPKGTLIRNTRQLSVVSKEELRDIAKRLELPTVKAEWLGANLLVEGIHNLTQLPPGTRLLFGGGVGLVVEGENLPCAEPGYVLTAHYSKANNLPSRFPKAALHRRGVVAWVERPGLLLPDDKVYST